MDCYVSHIAHTHTHAFRPTCCLIPSNISISHIVGGSAQLLLMLKARGSLCRTQQSTLVRSLFIVLGSRVRCECVFEVDKSSVQENQIWKTRSKLQTATMFVMHFFVCSLFSNQKNKKPKKTNWNLEHSNKFNVLFGVPHKRLCAL